MIQKKIIVTCDKCDSTEVTAVEKYYNHKFRMVKDTGSLDRVYPSLRSADKKLICHCNNCGNDFEEKLGSEHFELLPGEIEY